MMEMLHLNSLFFEDPFTHNKHTPMLSPDKKDSGPEQELAAGDPVVGGGIQETRSRLHEVAAGIDRAGHFAGGAISVLGSIARFPLKVLAGAGGQIARTVQEVRGEFRSAAGKEHDSEKGPTSRAA